jgi:hypothetical protein
MGIKKQQHQHFDFQVIGIQNKEIAVVFLFIVFEVGGFFRREEF